MKALLLLVLIFLAATNVSFAAPIIQSSSMQPSSIWMGESAIASVNCTDDASTITQNYVSITGPNLLLPAFYFSQTYGSIEIASDYFDRTGIYGAAFYCTNTQNESAISHQNFTVSKLTGYITSISPYPSYTGDPIEIDFMIRNDYNGDPVSSNVVFNVSLNDQISSLRMLPAYDMNKGWILRLDSPPSSGLYNLTVRAYYDRVSIANHSFVDVRKKIEFGIDSIERSTLNSNDNITVTLRAMDKGGQIDLGKNNLVIKINAVDAAISSISERGDLTDVAITVPSLGAGTYKLETFLSYGGSSYSDNRLVNYMVEIKGSMVDEDNRAVSSQIRFLQNGASKQSISTDSYGSYSGRIVPDNYDIDFSFPSSTLHLRGVVVNSFEDPMKYYYGNDFDIPGIRNAGLYDYEFTMPFYSASMEVSYEEKNVVNENNLRVFSCGSWNSGRKVCNSAWNEITGQIDTVRNRARINTTVLSAFVVGEAKGISIDFNTDKETYNIGEKITIVGLAKDEDKSGVGNASIQAKLAGADYKTKADANGVFSIEMQNPGYEGTYDIGIKADKYPYISYSGSKSISVFKSKEIMIDFPDTVKAAKGENVTQVISLVNTGQSDIDNIGFYMEGLQDSYYRVPNNTSLRSGEKKSMNIDFFIPFYAQGGISSATVKIKCKDIEQEKVFGLNIAQDDNAAQNQTSPTGYASSFAVPEISYTEVAYILIFATACFSASILLKKISIARKYSKDMSKTLMDTKNFLAVRNIKDKLPEEKYDKVILTEFPNFMRFSKKLVKDDEDAKGN